MKISDLAPTPGQIHRQTSKSDHALRATYGPRSKASGRTKQLASIIAGLRFAFPPAGHDQASAEPLWREASTNGKAKTDARAKTAIETSRPPGKDQT